jgi:glycosyltransferase involved in cell wall biosynthesis
VRTSVVICTYNGADTIVEQLDSIRNQTLKVDEVVICDDRSTDNTVDVVRSYIEKEQLSGWNIYVNENNLGYASNFFYAACKAQGDFIFFCDQDDIWVENRVEKMLAQMEKNPKILVLGSEFEPFTVSDDALSVPAWELATFKNDESMDCLSFNSKNIFIGCQGCTMCVRKSFWDSIVPYWFTDWAHDEFVWKLALVRNGLYFYHFTSLKRRVHSGNVSLGKMRNLGKRVKFLVNLLKSHEATLKYSIDNEMPESQQKLLKKHIKATKLRIDLMEKGKLLNVFPLTLFYSECYHKKRAIPVELYMAVKR